MDDFNESLLTIVDAHVARLADEEQRSRFLDAVASRFPALADETAERISQDLVRSAPRMLAEYQTLDEGNIERTRRQWGEALDLYRMLWASCHETGGTFSDRHFNVEDYEPPSMVHAQIGLQARACRVGSEVYTLLRAGMGAGALGRARTLQEIATISTVLREHGGDGGDHPNLADRYLLHANVVTWMDAVEYQEVAPKLGYEPLTESEMAEMQATRDAAVAAYGAAFGKPNGWASCLTKNQVAPRFKDLEALASADHLRAHYSWASHEVHADAKSWLMNHESHGGVTYRNTGPSNFGMADAGQLALMALVQVTENTVLSAPDIEGRPVDIILVEVLHKLLDRAWTALTTADATAET